MIHTKSLIRRLAYVPWLLAFGLVLGWAGEAQAQRDVNVELSLSATDIREGTNKDIKIKATLRAQAAGGVDEADTTLAVDVDVLLTFTTVPVDLNHLVRISKTIVTIPKTKAAGEVTINFSALQSPGRVADDSDFTITVGGVVGGIVDQNTATAAESVITIVDDDKDTSQIALTFDPPEVSQEAGPTTITVTATLNGETVTKKNLSFPLVSLWEQKELMP